jgi:hypothetical protein
MELSSSYETFIQAASRWLQNRLAEWEPKVVGTLWKLVDGNLSLPLACTSPSTMACSWNTHNTKQEEKKENSSRQGPLAFGAQVY